ncbi:MAG: CoA transferase [Dehalococcoidia bacterium]
MTGSRRVLDVSTGVGAAYAARLLADSGWDVVKYEPPGGDPLRRSASRWGGGVGGAFIFANVGKRGISVDFDRLERLATAADVVIGDFSPAALEAMALPVDAFERLKPRQAIVSVSPFGLTGPKARWASAEIVVQAASGLMFLTGEHNQPPMQLPPYQGEITGGVAGASAALLAVRSSRKDGALHRADVSLVEALAIHCAAQVSQYVYHGYVARREARIKGGLRMVPASDRFVYCAPGAVSSMRMDGIAVLLDEPKLAEERFQTAEGRMDNYDEFVELFVPPFRNRTAQEWFERAEAMHMTFALVQTLDELFDCPHLNARDFWRETTFAGQVIRLPDRPFRSVGGQQPNTRPAPSAPGVDTAEVLEEWLSPTQQGARN